MTKKTIAFAIAALAIFFYRAAGAEETRPLKVAVYPSAPCVIKDGGSFTGFDIELWEEIAKTLKLQYEYIEAKNFKDIIPMVMHGEADVALAGITITSEREDIVDFSYPYLDSGLRIMMKSKSDVQKQGEKTFLGRLLKFRALKKFGRAMTSEPVAEFFLAFFAILILISHVIWFIERGNALSKNYFRGVFEAFYFGIVTTSTVGYGDIAMKKWVSRAITIGLVVMGVAVYTNLEALVASDYVTANINYSINSPDDLKGKLVATQEDTTSVASLKRYKAKVVAVPDITDAYRKLLAGEVEAVVFDAPDLMYYAAHEGAGKVVLVGDIFERQDYGIVFAEGSQLRDKVSRVILQIKENGTYDRIYKVWFAL